ncbi:HTH-type transcriptional repressor YtrA [compost metagenome]|uniref:DNA-binding transcriptional regulator YhcF, GntR family n=1 Tax=Paenibacillus jilunlii TaxID=682956 RepID=A0A1G9NHC7_9BACL|nr:GntR family transcriptional regulator [Paenibacillus jilunlii]KWX79042.1 GntR family transcriptional regulator [Paenibacillus jilunlii]SDL85437.1 DNA-binding transcriptional regulator YhcF, GntR family [Paenibacillus jilunlii]
MKTNFDSSQPIFQQIAEMIEDDILNGTYQEGDQIISMAQFASTFQINPATAVKGIGLLVGEGILYKKRGLGMYVAEGAKQTIMGKRRIRFYDEMVSKLLEEAEKLGITNEDVIEMIKERTGADRK